MDSAAVTRMTMRTFLLEVKEEQDAVDSASASRSSRIVEADPGTRVGSCISFSASVCSR